MDVRKLWKKGGRQGHTLWAALLVGAAVYGCDPAADPRPDGLYVSIYTEKGTMVGVLDAERSPMTVTNFVGLAEGTIENDAFELGRPYYDGTTFHRVVEGHVVQTGVPDSEAAGGPGYTFPNEIHDELSHDRAGVLTMANGGPHTNAAQFSVTLGDRSYLDGDYIVFGEIVQGLDVAFEIEQGDVVDSIRIERVGEEAESFRPTTDDFRQMLAEAEERVTRDAERRQAAHSAWVERHHPDAEGPEGGVLTVESVLPEGPAAVPGDTFQVRYSGIRVRYMAHRIGYDGPELEEVRFGSGEDGAPGFHDPPQEFTWVRGESSIHEGFAEVVEEMAVGERRTVIVPPELGYGVAGAYPPEAPGEPRFVVGPNTLLVYEIEVVG
ncbi:MAG: peptidylprolyl isomerase [Gemmatimonadota bacterium]